MDAWQYLKIVEKPRSRWLFWKDNTGERLEALARIAEIGQPMVVAHLAIFLKDDNQKIRTAACDAIIKLFQHIDGKRKYSGLLRYCRFSVPGLNAYEASFSKDRFFWLLAISTFQESGYVREEAIHKLAQSSDPRAIPFIIYRMADWVLQVREAAKLAINQYKKPEFVGDLISNLPEFGWVLKSERVDLSDVYADVLNFIATENRGYVIEHFKSMPGRPRFLLAKHMSKTLSGGAEDIRLFLEDSHFLVRGLLFDHFERLDQLAINRLLKDPFAGIRLKTLYFLKGQPGFHELVREYLADTSSSIRYYARAVLRDSGLDFAAFYHDRLLGQVQVLGSLRGLGEVGGANNVASIKVYLQDHRIGIRKAAFIAMSKLDAPEAETFALANLDTEFAGLRSLIIDFLVMQTSSEAILKARELYAAGDHALKLSMLKLFSRMGGWVALPELMLGTIDEVEEVREMALSYLSAWRKKAIRLFLNPTELERNRIVEVFSNAKQVHDVKRYFDRNPLEGIDFFFR